MKTGKLMLELKEEYKMGDKIDLSFNEEYIEEIVDTFFTPMFLRHKSLKDFLTEARKEVLKLVPEVFEAGVQGDENIFSSKTSEPSFGKLMETLKINLVRKTKDSPSARSFLKSEEFYEQVSDALKGVWNNGYAAGYTDDICQGIEQYYDNIVALIRSISKEMVEPKDFKIKVDLINSAIDQANSLSMDLNKRLGIEINKIYLIERIKGEEK
jgi:hypothetical protein